MPYRRNLGVFILAAALPAVVAGAAAPTGSPEEHWLSHIVLDDLDRAAAGRQRTQHAKRLEAIMLARLACGRLNELGALTDMVYALRACRWLPLIEKDDAGRALGRWLLDHRDVSRRLFRAVADVPSPAAALERFRQLHAADPRAVEDYADLAVAFATANELRHYRRQANPASLLAAFRYYIDPNNSFHFDLKKMPYELARYLADTRCDIAERKWAVRMYGRSQKPTKAYFDVDYDCPHFEDGKPQRMASVPYTLPNIARLGGICLDQAYYASEVCKALGVPAAIVFGRGGTGVSHAWFAYLTMGRSGARAAWISRTGRYQEHLYYVGTLREPAGGEMILDSELMLLGSAARLPLRRREEADAAAFAAQLADKARDGGPAADVGPLKQLAAAYRSRYKASPSCPPLRAGWIAARRKIDLSLVEDLIDVSIRRNLAHRPAWELLVALRKADRLPVKDLNRFFTVLVRRTAGRYPEYSCLMIMRIVPTIPDAARREAIYRRNLTVYGKRADLRGRLLIALGDDYRDRRLNAKAIETYQNAADGCVYLAEVVVKAAGRAEKLLLAAGRRDQAIDMYRRLFAKTRRQEVAEIFRTETSHYQLGLRLAALLKAAGQNDAAKQVLAKIKG